MWHNNACINMLAIQYSSYLILKKSSQRLRTLLLFFYIFVLIMASAMFNITLQYTTVHNTYLELLRIVNDAVSSSVNRFLTTAVASSGTAAVNVSTRAILEAAGLFSNALTGSGKGVPIATLVRSIVSESGAKYKHLHQCNQHYYQ